MSPSVSLSLSHQARIVIIRCREISAAENRNERVGRSVSPVIHVFVSQAASTPSDPQGHSFP